jgi:hypothetical protein
MSALEDSELSHSGNDKLGPFPLSRTAIGTLGRLIKSEGKIVVAKDLRLAFVGVRDTGAVAARILQEPERQCREDLPTIYRSGRPTRNSQKVFSEVLERLSRLVGLLEQIEAAT